MKAGTERLRRRDKAGARALDRWLSEVVSDYRDRILPVDTAVGLEWGRLEGSSPETLSPIDGLIAATARVHRLVIATRNVRDYSRMDVQVVNPFEEVE